MFKTKIVPHIPNTITLLNLISGAVGVLLVMEDQIIWACFMIYIAAVFDFLDGFIARILKASSEIGKSLDSLADMISFGFLPAAIVFYIIKLIILQANPEFSLLHANLTEIFLLASSAFILAFSALRLAKFNTDSRQTYGFIGVPTPSTAILISSFPFILQDTGSIGAVLLMKLYIIIPLTLILSFLMVSEIPMISLKFKNYSFSDNIYKYLMIVLSVVCLLLWGLTSIPLIFLFYLVFSILESRNTAKKSI